MSSDESGAGVEIPVWISGSEKLMTGLTKRTTCDDVIYSLLHHDGLSPLEIEPVLENYVIYEKWRKVERPLHGRAKIVKVWRAWGAERSHVKLTMRKIQPSAAAMLRSRRTRGQHRRRISSEEFFDAEKKRSEKMKQQKFEDVLQLVFDQQRKLQTQMNRIRHTDADIENIETNVHVHRMREKGINYLQDSYLQSLSDDSSGLEDAIPKMKIGDLELYLSVCENIIRVEERIASENEKIQDLSYHIREEHKTEGVHNNIDKQPSEKVDICSEIKILKERLKIATSVGEFQRKELENLNGNFIDCEVELEQKTRQNDVMSRELNALEQFTVQSMPIDPFSNEGGSYSENRVPECTLDASAHYNLMSPSQRSTAESPSSSAPEVQHQINHATEATETKLSTGDQRITVTVQTNKNNHDVFYPIIANRTNLVPLDMISYPDFERADWFQGQGRLDLSRKVTESVRCVPIRGNAFSRTGTCFTNDIKNNNSFSTCHQFSNDIQNVRGQLHYGQFPVGYRRENNVEISKDGRDIDKDNIRSCNTNSNATSMYSCQTLEPRRTSGPTNIEIADNIVNNDDSQYGTVYPRILSNTNATNSAPTSSEFQNNQDKSRHLSIEKLASHLNFHSTEISLIEKSQQNSPLPRVSFSDAVQEQDHFTSMLNILCNNNRGLKMDVKPIKSILKYSVNDYYYPTGLTELILNKADYENDSNSDTGLSSLHSDEGSPIRKAPPILETLV